jgi:hypothetical protein
VVALVKELRATEAELATLPEEKPEVSPVDGIIAGATATNDELAARRADRQTGASAS